MAPPETGKWTEGDKASLLLQIMTQLKPERGGIDWARINIEGRTKKGCQNQWFKFCQLMKAEAGEIPGDGSASGPNKTASEAITSTTTPAKRRRGRKGKELADPEEETEEPKTKRPVKSVRRAKSEAIEVAEEEHPINHVKAEVDAEDGIFLYQKADGACVI